MSEFVNAGNNYRFRLSSSMSENDTDLPFDHLTAEGTYPGDFPFLLTINSGRSNMEIVKVIGPGSDLFTYEVERGQEGTTAQAHEAGSIVENNFTAGTYQALVDEIKALKQQLGIAEMGENENGSYIRYENGVQECWWHRDSFNVSTSTATYQGLTIYRNTNEVKWEYPAEFSEIPTIQFTAGLGGSSLAPTLFRVYNIGLDLARCQLQTFTDFDEIGHANYFAIGRWK